MPERRAAETIAVGSSSVCTGMFARGGAAGKRRGCGRAGTNWLPGGEERSQKPSHQILTRRSGAAPLTVVTCCLGGNGGGTVGHDGIEFSPSLVGGAGTTTRFTDIRFAAPDVAGSDGGELVGSEANLVVDGPSEGGRDSGSWFVVAAGNSAAATSKITSTTGTSLGGDGGVQGQRWR